MEMTPSPVRRMFSAPSDSEGYHTCCPSDGADAEPDFPAGRSHTTPNPELDHDAKREVLPRRSATTRVPRHTELRLREWTSYLRRYRRLLKQVEDWSESGEIPHLLRDVLRAYWNKRVEDEEKKRVKKRMAVRIMSPEEQQPGNMEYLRRNLGAPERMIKEGPYQDRPLLCPFRLSPLLTCSGSTIAFLKILNIQGPNPKI